MPRPRHPPRNCGTDTRISDSHCLLRGTGGGRWTDVSGCLPQGQPPSPSGQLDSRCPAQSWGACRGHLMGSLPNTVSPLQEYDSQPNLCPEMNKVPAGPGAGRPAPTSGNVAWWVDWQSPWAGVRTRLGFMEHSPWAWAGLSHLLLAKRGGQRDRGTRCHSETRL